MWRRLAKFETKAEFRLKGGVSLPLAWTKKMTVKLDKEKEENVQTEMTFAQNLKSQIAELNDKLDKLLDLQLSGTISTEEYVEKKQKILNQKIEISEKLKTFQQNGYSWLKPAKNFILASNEAKNVASGTNLAEKADFLKKVGSNLVLLSQNIKYFPRGAWKIYGNLLHFSAEPRSGEAQKSGNFSKHLLWQGRQGSNLQPEILEIPALPIRATPLFLFFKLLMLCVFSTSVAEFFQL